MIESSQGSDSERHLYGSKGFQDHIGGPLEFHLQIWAYNSYLRIYIYIHMRMDKYAEIFKVNK